MYKMRKEIDEKERKEVIDLLRKQMAVEGQLVRLYKETAGNIQSSPVRHILHMIQLDSMKHIDICQVAIDVLQGKDILKQEKKEIIEGLKQHIELEKASIKMAKKILDNAWIREIQGLNKLIKRWRDDEKYHHKELTKMVKKRFFRLDPLGLIDVVRTPQEMEEWYLRTKK